MTLEQLRIFAMVAQHQHVTKAAKALNMTQSAVSAAVQALEQRHGITLFDRVGRSIQLNQTGQVFLGHALRVLSEMRAAEAALTDLGGLQRGELSVMASQTVGAYWLPPRLARFHRKYPGISLDVRMGNTETVANAVEAGLVEIGIIEGKVDRPVLASKVISQDEMVLVAPPGHDLAGRAPVTADRLAASAWVLREQGSGTRDAFETVMRGQGLSMPDLKIAMVLPGNEAVLGAVQAGIGATLISRSAASTGLAAGVIVELAFPAVPRPFFLLRHKERYHSESAKAFQALLA